MSEKVEIVYKGAVPGGLKVMTDGETVWLTQEQMCLLFGRERSVITKHINNVFKEGELLKSVAINSVRQMIRSCFRTHEGRRNHDGGKGIYRIAFERDC